MINGHLFQADERVAPPRDPDRNLSHVYDNLVDRVALPPANLHAMRVEATDLAAAAQAYAGGTARRSRARRRCSTSCAWGSAPTATRRRWCRATRCSPKTTPT